MDEAILRGLYLGMQHNSKKLDGADSWMERALNQFAMIDGDRVPTID